MKCFVLLTVLAFASKNENDVESVAANLGENFMENAAENPIVVKIEEDEYTKKRRSNYIGVSCKYPNSKWFAQRWSKNEKKQFNTGSYRDEETAAHASDTLARKLMAKGEQGHKLNFPDDNTEVHTKEKKSSSEFIGVSYKEKMNRWCAYRWSKMEQKEFHCGVYKSEEAAAQASDTLARKLMANGEKDQKLNFPDDNTEVYPGKKIKNSKFFGVSYNEKMKRWCAQRWSRSEKKHYDNGTYKNEETTARASDTLARKLMKNGEQNHKLNFPDDSTEVFPEEKTKNSKYFGVSYNEKKKRWFAQRWSKIDKKLFSNRYHKDEETAAHASDTLARKLIQNGEQGHKLNFPDEKTEEQPQHHIIKRKRSFDFGDYEADENNLEKFEEKEE